MANQVISGPFVGKTRAQLLVLLSAAQDSLANGGGQITGASIGGQSFGKTSGLSVTERIKLITAALAQVDPDYLPPGQTVYGQFTSPDSGGCFRLPGAYG